MADTPPNYGDGHIMQSLDSRVVRLESAVDGIRGDVHGVKSSIEKIERLITSSRSVNWQALSLLLTLVTMAAALIGYVFTSIQSDVRTHIEQPGHLPSLIEAARDRGRIDTLTELLQRQDVAIVQLQDRIHQLEQRKP